MTDAIKITNQHADFTGLRWTAIVKPKADVRYYLNYLFVEPGGRVVATDGHRLHLYKPSTANLLEPGYYAVPKLTKTQILLEPANEDPRRYPDFWRVLYDVDEAALQWIELSPSPDVALYQIIRNLDVCLRYDYVLDTLSLSEMTTKRRTRGGEPVLPVTLDAAKGTGNHPSLYLRHGERYHAVIAPMNTGIKKEKSKAA